MAPSIDSNSAIDPRDRGFTRSNYRLALGGKFRDLARAGLATLPVTAAFSAGYLAVWTAFSLLAEAAHAAIRAVPSPQALALCLTAAKAWQLTLPPSSHRSEGMAAHPATLAATSIAVNKPTASPRPPEKAEYLETP
jgi:hypothetical protein